VAAVTLAAFTAAWLLSALDHDSAAAKQIERAQMAARPAAAAWMRLVGDAAGPQVQLVEAAYTLRLGVASDRLAVVARNGAASHTLPLTMLAGRAALPPRTRFTAITAGSQLTVTARAVTGSIIELAIVRGWPAFFTVRFLSSLGREPSLPAQFFVPSGPGPRLPHLGMAFSPSGRTVGQARTASIRLGTRPPAVTAPFAPPPFDLELRTRAGWLGLGLVQVPDATAMALRPNGALTVNYPLSLLASFPDHGAGGRVPPPSGDGTAAARSQTWLRFPAFAVTAARGPLLGVRAYHAALARLGAAPVAAPPGGRPGWWTWPMADTWGQQRATGTAWGARGFTGSWVRGFARAWRRQFGLHHFTIVIDSRWQASFGSATPSPRFGGVAGMRNLIAQLHAAGLRVLLWWPLWVSGSVTARPLGQVDPTAPGFAAAITRTMRLAVGHRPGQLGADGLKLDWGYHVPQRPLGAFARPARGVGAAALLRYMTLLSRAAWAANRSALIDASAVAPQFGGTEDAIRLYDAGTNQAWNRRAAIVSQVDPGILIDGDGWRLRPTQAVAHILSSAVYGIPAVYFATRWANGARIPLGFARALGAAMALTAGRGQGGAHPLRGGGWGYMVAGRLAARTLDGGRAVEVIRRATCPRRWRAILVSMASGWLTIALPEGSPSPVVRGQRGAPARWTASGRWLRLRVRTGVGYTVTLPQRDC